jgi:benzaldehyde dehydrogenase (NAD)
MTDTINLLIGGKAVAATGGRVFERRNPLDGSVASRAAAATPDDARAAVEAAARAFPGWSQTSPAKRRELLVKGAHALEARAADFTAAMSAETGASAIWAGFNVHLAADMLIEAAAMTTQISGEVIPSNVPEQPRAWRCASRQASCSAWRPGTRRSSSPPAPSRCPSPAATRSC